MPPQKYASGTPSRTPPSGVAHPFRGAGRLPAVVRSALGFGESGLGPRDTTQEAQVGQHLAKSLQLQTAAQLASFRGRTARKQIASFLRAHLKAVKDRQGDALFRARSYNLAINATIADTWEASRQQAIDRICDAFGMPEPSRKARACLRAWIGFHDQLVLALLADRAISEAEILRFTLRQLDHLAVEEFAVDLDREVLADALARSLGGRS